MKRALVDLHSHILPGVDDGAENWDQSLKMLQNAANEGIRKILATPHILSEPHFREENKIVNIYEELKKRVREQGIKIEIFLACEIMAQPDTSLEHRIATFNDNKKYFLIEFPMNSIPRFVPEKLFEFVTDEKIPIIAHPERNFGFRQRPDFVYDYIQRGNLMQVNEGSLRGRFGKEIQEFAMQMIEHNSVHFVASDGHKVDRRTVTLRECYELVAEEFGKKMANLLFIENPEKAILGEKIEIDEPIPIARQVKKGILRRLKEMRAK
ncbi:MAG: tyrosine protein phosphatase [Calditrichaeota bacterium]|nr:tyrosine protein phosphatase [Calditrichota bacterium]